MVMPVAEVVPKKEFFDYEAKYDAKMSDEIIPGRFLQRLPAGFRIWLPRYMTSCGVKESSVSDGFCPGGRNHHVGSQYHARYDRQQFRPQNGPCHGSPFTGCDHRDH